MPAYRFSWDSFDDTSVEAFARDIGYEGSAEGARGFLTAQVSRPNDDFVRKTKKSIVKHWLPKHGRVGASIVRELWDRQIGPMGAMPTDASGCAQYVDRCRNSTGLRELLEDRLISFGDTGRDEDWDPDANFIPRFGTVVPAKQVLKRPSPFPHQTEAWDKLDGHLRESASTGVFKGLLAMPTGSGKTHTATHWLLRNWINVRPGNHVLWIAHRDELLRQAADSFYRLSGLADNRERLRIRIVSGRHCPFHLIDDADDVILCSVNSLARALAHAEQLLQNPQLFLVIDEAHHAPATSYRSAIGVLEKAASHRLLGLTATPTRTKEDERPELARLFGGRILYQAKASDLIARELLARPVPGSVTTGVDAELGMTTEDREHVRDFHELSPDMRERLGRNEHRNQVIVKHYLDNREKYGKTLIFTTDVHGAAVLADAFRGRLPEGAEAAYVASYRPDAKPGERQDVDRDLLGRYRDPRSGLNVLINVDMLTEGVDLPMTRTVFLARPTSSEILLRQMIGRALRGPAAGGHRLAHIVSFEDHWRQFRDILSPMHLLNEMLPDVELLEPTLGPSVPIEESIPGDELPATSWDHIMAFSRAIRASLPDPESDLFEAVPHGMFVFEYDVEGEPTRHVIHVYEHQRTCWDALFKSLRSYSSTELATLDAGLLDADFFGDCEPPLPESVDIGRILEAVRNGSALPEYVPLAARPLCDPRELAKAAREKDLRSSEIDALLTERHTPLAKVIYPKLLDFRRAFDDAMRELQFPGEAPRLKGIVLFERPPSSLMRKDPPHDLKRLFDEMLAKGSELLGETITHDQAPQWSKRPIKGWFGVAHPAGIQAGRIRVNCLLNSPDFSEESLRFLLWHEYLHIRLKTAGHDDQFRQLERKWPNFLACDREMDSLNERFGVQYW